MTPEETRLECLKLCVNNFIFHGSKISDREVILISKRFAEFVLENKVMNERKE